MYRISVLIAFICFVAAAGCTIKNEPAIINRHAEVWLTNKNELQFRFEINEKVFTTEKMFKVKVQIHNEKLAAALGSKEIVYGEKEIYDGELLEVKNNKQVFIYMDPIPLLADLHIFEIHKMIKEQQAVSVEIMSNEEVIAKTYLTNFSSQM